MVLSVGSTPNSKQNDPAVELLLAMLLEKGSSNMSFRACILYAMRASVHRMRYLSTRCDASSSTAMLWEQCKVAMSYHKGLASKYKELWIVPKANAAHTNAQADAAHAHAQNVAVADFKSDHRLLGDL